MPYHTMKKNGKNHNSKNHNSNIRKYQTAPQPNGAYYGDNGRGGYAWKSRGKEYEKWHATHKPDVSVEGALLRPEPKSNRASEHDDTHKPFTNVPPSAGGIQLFEYTIDSETNNEERRQLNMPDAL